MKKLFIKDEDEEIYEMEEIQAEPEVVEEKRDEEIESLSADEIIKLKRLAGIADKLLEMFSEPKEEVREEEEEEEEEIVEDEEIEEKKEEKVIETDSCRDSKKAFGSLESRTSSDNDVIEDQVSSAWAKRYGGK